MHTIPEAAQAKIFAAIEHAWDNPITNEDAIAAQVGEWIVPQMNEPRTRAASAVGMLLNQFTAKQLEPLFTEYGIDKGTKQARVSDVSDAIVVDLLG